MLADDTYSLIKRIQPNVYYARQLDVLLQLPGGGQGYSSWMQLLKLPGGCQVFQLNTV